MKTGSINGMMTEHATLTRQQTNVEQEAVFLNASDSEPERTTSDVILVSEDSAAPLEKTTIKGHDELVEADYASKKAEFSAMLDFKVKNELIAQVFAKRTPKEKETFGEGAISIGSVARVLKAEMNYEQDRNFQNATYLENTAIPAASMREEPLYGKPSVYSQGDVDGLWVRSDSYRKMADYIGNTTPRSEDEFYELAEAYIERLREEAQTEAIAILKQQKRQAEEKISALNKTIDIITHERDDARHEVQQRDMEMLDDEFEVHMQQSVDRLTQEARSIAR